MAGRTGYAAKGPPTRMELCPPSGQPAFPCGDLLSLLEFQCLHRTCRPMLLLLSALTVLLSFWFVSLGETGCILEEVGMFYNRVKFW